MVSCISVININLFLSQKRDPIQQKLSIAVQDLQSAIESKDMELAVNKHTTTEALNARDIARGRLDEFGKKAVELQTNVARMIKISTDIQCQLDLRHHEASKKHQVSNKVEFQVVDHTVIDYKHSFVDYFSKHRYDVWTTDPEVLRSINNLQIGVLNIITPGA